MTGNGARFAAFCWFHRQFRGKRLFFQGRHSWKYSSLEYTRDDERQWGGRSPALVLLGYFCISSWFLRPLLGCCPSHWQSSLSYYSSLDSFCWRTEELMLCLLCKVTLPLRRAFGVRLPHDLCVSSTWVCLPCFKWQEGLTCHPSLWGQGTAFSASVACTCTCKTQWSVKYMSGFWSLGQMQPWCNPTGFPIERNFNFLQEAVAGFARRAGSAFGFQPSSSSSPAPPYISWEKKVSPTWEHRGRKKVAKQVCLHKAQMLDPLFF